MNKLKEYLYWHFFYRPDFSSTFHSLVIDISFSMCSMLLRYDEGNKKSFDIFYLQTSKKIKVFTKHLQRKNYFSDYKWKSMNFIADESKSLLEDFSNESFKSVYANSKKLKKLQDQVFNLVILINQKVEDDVDFIKSVQLKAKK